MVMGFIPRENHGDEPGCGGGELNTASERWHAWQAAEALELSMLLKDSQDALLQEVRRYAHLLELIDPDHHNSAQAIGDVVLSLSCAETAEERLEILTSEAERLMLAVAKVRGQRAEGHTVLGKRQPAAGGKPLIRFAPCVLDALLWGGIFVLVLLIG